MADFTGILETIKKASLDAVGAAGPVVALYGTVSSADPLKIDVEQKMTLESDQLVLTRNVTDYNIEMTVSHFTENETSHTHGYIDSGAGQDINRDTDPTSHLHAYAGRKTYTVHNGLIVGDKVLLMRVQGGQKFILIDRVV